MKNLFSSKSLELTGHLLLSMTSLIVISTAIAFGDGVHDLRTAFIIFVALSAVSMIIPLILYSFQPKNDEIKTKAITITRELIRALLLTLLAPIAVLSFYHFQSNEMHSAAFISGIPLGLYFAAIYTVNRLRSFEEKCLFQNTVFKNRNIKLFLQTQFALCIIAAPLIPTLIYLLINDHIYILTCSAVVLFSIPLLYLIFTKSDASSFKEALSLTKKILIAYLFAFSLGWIV
jgi:hypothetical protein